MPRPVGYGRPGTPVFPPAWSQTNAAVETTTYESHVIIGTAEATRAWDPARRQTVTTAPAPAYDGPASIRPGMRDDLAAPRENIADDLVRVNDYEICLPMPTGGISESMVATVVDSPDAMLVGRTLTVTFVELGDRRFTRLLGATLNA